MGCERTTARSKTWTRRSFIAVPEDNNLLHAMGCERTTARRRGHFIQRRSFVPMVCTTWPVLIAYLMQLSFIAWRVTYTLRRHALLLSFEVVAILMLLTTVLTDAK